MIAETFSSHHFFAIFATRSAIQASILLITPNREYNQPVRMFRFSDPQNIPWAALAIEVHKPEPRLPEDSGGKAYLVSTSNLTSLRLDAKYYDPIYEVIPPSTYFEVVQLGEIVEIRSGDRFPEENLQIGGVPFIQVRNINPDGSLSLKGVKTIKPGIASDSRSYSQLGDILISTAGTIGKVALVPPHLHVCIDTSMRRLRIKNEKKILPEYLALYLRSETAKLQMERWFSGSVIRVLSTPNLEQIMVFVPDIDHQNKIITTFHNQLLERYDQLLSVFPDMEKMQALSEKKGLPAATEAPLQLPIASISSKEIPLQEIIRKDFPFPISRAFKAFESSANESPSKRIKKLISLSEAIVYYIYGILVADQLQRIKHDDPDLKNLLTNSLTDYSMDRRIKYVFRFFKLVQDYPDLGIFIPELIDAEFWVCKEIHNNIRNKFSHEDLPDAWCRKAVTDYYPKLMKLLESLLLLRDYRLAQVTKVTVRDNRPQHHVVTMMGDNPLFQTQVEDLDTLLLADTQHIVLLDQNYNILDLHPFYVVHAWESTGMQNHLCLLKQITGQSSKQRLKLESTEGAGETEMEMDLMLSSLLAAL